MTTLRDIFTACAPEYLERYPQLPLAHRKVISAIQQCRSGAYGMEFLRRFLQHALPEGFMKVRHFGFLHASCALPLATICRLIGQVHAGEGQPRPRQPPPPRVARCPTCGVPMGIVMRVWTSPRALVDTS